MLAYCDLSSVNYAYMCNQVYSYHLGLIDVLQWLLSMLSIYYTTSCIRNTKQTSEQLICYQRKWNVTHVVVT